MTLDLSLAATSLWTISDWRLLVVDYLIHNKVTSSWIDKQNNLYFVGEKRARKVQITWQNVISRICHDRVLFPRHKIVCKCGIWASITISKKKGVCPTRAFY